MSTALITASGLKKSYGSRSVVNGISLSVYEHEILSIIGPNGAGKSTTVEMILGIRKQDEGTVSYWSSDYKKQVGVQLQSTPFFQGLTTYENLRLFAALYKRKITKVEGVSILAFCGLDQVMNIEASKLSGGQQKRLAIAIALVHEPKIVCLDEPTAALDPRSRAEIHELIQKLHESGKTVVFTSHDMDEVSRLSHRIVMIDQGTVIAEGSADDLCEKYEVSSVEELYLQLTKGEK